MKLGPLEINTDKILAPMMDITDPPFQALVQSYGGVGMVVVPMVFINQIEAAPKTVIPFLEDAEKRRPSGVQIVGSGRDKGVIQKAIEILNMFDFDAVDINAGCPARRTCSSGGGCSLIQDLSDERLKTMIEVSIKHSNKPVTVKTRLGWENADQFLEIAKFIEDAGAEVLTIHGRTRAQGYGDQVDYEKIAQIKQALSIPVVGNGDIVDFSTYQAMKDTGVDAVMIGRAVKRNPEIFGMLEKTTAPDQWETYVPTLSKVREYITFLSEYVDQAHRFWNNPRYKTSLLRRTSIWFIKGIPNYKPIRLRISRMDSYKEIYSFIMGDEIEKIIDERS